MENQTESKGQEPAPFEWRSAAGKKAYLLEQVWAGPNAQRAHSVQEILDSASSAPVEYRNYQALVERAIEVFGDELKAALWLSTPSADLGDKVPLQIAQSIHYAAEELRGIFEPIFLRIEHGIYT